MRKFNVAMIVVWSAMGILVVVALVGGIVYDWNWMRRNGTGSQVMASEIAESTYVQSAVEHTVEATTTYSSNPSAGAIPKGMEVHLRESYKAGDIDTIKMSVGVESAYIRYGDVDTITITQYGDRDLDSGRIVQVSKSGSTLELKSPKKIVSVGLNWGWDTELEVLLPASYAGSLDLSVSYGELVVEDSWNLDTLRLNTSAGEVITYGTLASNSATISASAGTLDLGHIQSGSFSISVSAGEIDVDRLTGSGSVSASAGSVYLDHVTISDSLSLSTSAGEIEVRLEPNQSFQFSGTSQMGEIETYFPTDSTGTMNQRHNATVGDGPYVSLDASVAMGNIEIGRA